MKRIISIIMAIVMMVLLAVPVAAGDFKSPRRPTVLPELAEGPPYEIVEIDDELDKYDDEYAKHRVWVPAPDMFMYTYGQRRRLNPTEITSFQDSYAVIKKETKDVVLYFFWLTLSRKYLEYLEDYDDYYFKLVFNLSSDVEDGDIVFSLNGVDISDDLVIVNGDGTVTAFFEYLPAPIVIRIRK